MTTKKNNNSKAKAVVKPVAKAVAKPAVKAAPVKGKSVASATSAAILGKPRIVSDKNGMPSNIKPEWQKYYKTLLDLRERLLHQMSGLAKE